MSRAGDSLWLEPSQYAAASDPNFRLYVVENVRQGDPKLFALRVIEGQQLLAEMVQRAKEKNYFLLPWSTTIYDKMQVERLP